MIAIKSVFFCLVAENGRKAQFHSSLPYRGDVSEADRGVQTPLNLRFTPEVSRYSVRGFDINKERTKLLEGVYFDEEIFEEKPLGFHGVSDGAFMLCVRTGNVHV